MESGGLYFVGAFERNVASAAAKVFSYLIYVINALYICNLKAI